MRFRYGDVVQIKELDYENEDWAAASMGEFAGDTAIVRDVTDRSWAYPQIRLCNFGFATNPGRFDQVSGFWWAPHSLTKIGNIFETPELVRALIRDIDCGEEVVCAAIPRRRDGRGACHWMDDSLSYGFAVSGSPMRFVSIGERNLRIEHVDAFEVCPLDSNTILENAPYVTDDYERPSASVRCVACGNRFDPEEEATDVEEDRQLCPHCRKREFVLPYHHYTPKLDFWKMPNERTNLYFGMEIEADNGGESRSTAKQVVRQMNTEPGKWFMYVTHDGSLRNGIEMVTAPCTLKYHLAQADRYRALFKDLVRQGYRAHNTTTCGLHVHFSRAFYADNEEENICKLLYLVEKFWDDIVILSRRNYRELSRYYKKCGKDHEQFVCDWNKSNEHAGHYFAVNITNTDTIELRMFRGTLNVDTMLATLEFVDKLVRTAKSKTSEQLQRLTFNELLTPASRKLYQARLALLNFEDVTKEAGVTETEADDSLAF